MTNDNRLQGVAIPFAGAAAVLLWCHIAFGWTPFWYDPVLGVCLIATLVLQAFALRFALADRRHAR